MHSQTAESKTSLPSYDCEKNFCSLLHADQPRTIHSAGDALPSLGLHLLIYVIADPNPLCAIRAWQAALLCQSKSTVDSNPGRYQRWLIAALAHVPNHDLCVEIVLLGTTNLPSECGQCVQSALIKSTHQIDKSGWSQFSQTKSTNWRTLTQESHDWWC